MTSTKSNLPLILSGSSLFISIAGLTYLNSKIATNSNESIDVSKKLKAAIREINKFAKLEQTTQGVKRDIDITRQNLQQLALAISKLNDEGVRQSNLINRNSVIIGEIEMHLQEFSNQLVILLNERKQMKHKFAEMETAIMEIQRTAKEKGWDIKNRRSLSDESGLTNRKKRINRTEINNGLRTNELRNAGLRNTDHIDDYYDEVDDEYVEEFEQPVRSKRRQSNMGRKNFVPYSPSRANIGGYQSRVAHSTQRQTNFQAGAPRNSGRPVNAKMGNYRPVPGDELRYTEGGRIGMMKLSSGQGNNYIQSSSTRQPTPHQVGITNYNNTRRTDHNNPGNTDYDNAGLREPSQRKTGRESAMDIISNLSLDISSPIDNTNYTAADTDRKVPQGSSKSSTNNRSRTRSNKSSETGLGLDSLSLEGAYRPSRQI